MALASRLELMGADDEQPEQPHWLDQRSAVGDFSPLYDRFWRADVTQHDAAKSFDAAYSVPFTTAFKEGTLIPATLDD
jgi:hypothetical protein